MGWWIALAVVVLLAILPLGASVIYDADGPLIKIIAGFLRIQIIPAKKKKKPQKEKKKKEKKAASQQPEATADQPETADHPAEGESHSAETLSEEKPGKKPKKEKKSKAKSKDKPKEKSGGSILDFLPLVKLGLDFLGDFFGRKLRVNCLELKLTMAGGDPCDLAVNYGRAWAAIGNLWPRLERMMVIKKRDVNIQCDFEGDKTLIYARLDITITLGRLLGLVVCYAVRALITYLKIRKKRKGGATT